MTKSFAFLALVLTVASPVFAQGIVSPTVGDNRVALAIQLPGGLGADLSITFEKAVGLSLANLGLSAEVLNPLDPALLTRLPAALPGGGGVTIPTAFPVLVRIEPPAAGGLSFSGIVAIELHTHNLNFVANTPLRLFAAPLGGRFHDITETMGMGSYRVRGTKGSFSEFLIVADLRSLDRVIGQKFDRLEDVLAEHGGAIAEPLREDLIDLLESARAAYTTGATLTAIQRIESFTTLVREHSGAEIPDVWRSSRDLVNVAGMLRAAAGTLRFSLNLKASQGSGSGILGL